MAGWVYILASKKNGTLYIGVTSDLVARSYQHREGLVEGFSKRHGVKMLVYYEQFGRISEAIQREKTMKHWPRAWKLNLIRGFNPEWRDLLADIAN
jgi:putative endonuclease